MEALARVVESPAPRGAAIHIKGVRRTYTGAGVSTPVLRGIDLELRPGTLNVILGASGSGKTTLLNIVGAIDRADAGQVQVAGVDLTRANARELVQFRRERIGFIFQFYNLMPTLNAVENVEVALEHQRSRSGGERMSLDERRALAEELLAQVGLSAHGHKFPAQLSGGEQQRVAVARALVRRPQLLLCDEPTGNLDADSGRMIVALIDRLRLEAGSTAVVVTHNPELFPNPDRVVHIRDGVVVE